MHALDYKQWVERHNLVMGQLSAWLLTDMGTDRDACACAQASYRTCLLPCVHLTRPERMCPTLQPENSKQER